jgi:hypothetical protein
LVYTDMILQLIIQNCLQKDKKEYLYAHLSLLKINNPIPEKVWIEY